MRVGILFVVMLFVSLCMACGVFANVPYETFSRDHYNRSIHTQPFYTPVAVLGGALFIPSKGRDGGTGTQTLLSPFKQPQDMFIDHNDGIYVLDSGNNRVVRLDAAGNLIRVIEVAESPLNNPQGIFVQEDGLIYIADTGNGRVVKINEEGRIVQEFARPDSKFLSESFQYVPTKVTVDRRGFLYIVNKGSYHGLMQLDSKGQFHGFFANNKTQASWMDIVKRMLYSEQQLSRKARLLPNPITNVDMDDTGYIYTTTLGVQSEQIKKFNISGDNRLSGLSFGEITATEEYPSADLVDVDVDIYGNMTTIDRKYNRVSQYDKLGNLLFYWTGSGQGGSTRLGVIDQASAIGTNSKNELFIMDASQNLIHKFEPTAFGNLVHEAIRLTQRGQYAESESYWREIVRLNANFSPAYYGLGLAAYHDGQYELAMDDFKLSGHARGYSDAFWQVRLHWFQRHFATFANALIILLVASWAAKKFGLLAKAGPMARRLYPRKVKLIEQLRFAFSILKHPIDGFADLRYANKGGYASACLLLFGVVVSLMLKSVYTGFSFQAVPEGSVSSSTIVIQFAAVFCSWVVCHYLISSIYLGEGRFKDVFVGSAYSLFPVILLVVPITAISNLMTLSEASIYAFMNGLVVIWCGLLFFWQVQALQNYSVKETIINLTLTIISIVLLWVLIFILFGLSSEFIRFLNAVYKEVSIR
ncbi:YIP1 family protein [Cohnella yongneupensis]|uniref:YIP1 family protein n=1 Tax=Cohnella yongneupensis TaxID=425006 RepID=A0ABW0QZT8_9BACL